MSVLNALSIDLESWVHMSPYVLNSTTRKEGDAGYIIEATEKILTLFQRCNVKTTFFVVGEIFEWYPQLIYLIKEMGHEIAWHTHTHRKLLTQKDLVIELEMSRSFIKEFHIKGFRAPQAFMKEEYLPILRDYGFLYDSSVYSQTKVVCPIDGIKEVPISTLPFVRREVRFPKALTLRLCISELPFGSGYFVGVFGSTISRFITYANKGGWPSVLFVHPWQLVSPPNCKRIFMRIGLRDSKMLPYLVNRWTAVEHILQKHEFGTIWSLIKMREQIDQCKQGESTC